nr:LysR family transcriptional regulator [Bacilli bacterium]
MELRHLRYFITLAEELHFGRAAAQLHIAQPALSQQIRQLEEQLGFALFLRDKHQVTLTDAGKTFLAEARMVLIAVKRATETAKRVHEGAIGRLLIGFVGSATYHLLPMLTTYRESFPLVHVELQQMKSLEQLQALHEKRIDIGLIRPTSTSLAITQKTIFQEALLVALPQNHSLTGRTSIAMHELVNESFIVAPMRSGSSYYEVVMQACLEANFTPHITLEAPEFHTVIAFVAYGLGIALIPESFARQKHAGVVYLPILNVKPRLELALAWRSDAISSVVRTFIDHQQAHPVGQS